MNDRDQDPDAPVTEDEARDAAALAAGGDAPEARVAALLQHSRRGDLSGERAAAVRAGLSPSLRRRRTRWWLGATLLIPAAAGLLVVARVQRSPAPPAVSAAPPLAVLRAQAAVARAQPQSLAVLDREMRAYRRALFARVRGAEASR